MTENPFLTSTMQQCNNLVFDHRLPIRFRTSYRLSTAHSSTYRRIILLKEDSFIVTIAGATGLIGTELTKQLLDEKPIAHIYAITRRDLPLFANKLEIIKHPELKVQTWDDEKPRPELGFICLGTTIQQAGSKDELERIDYDLVCQVAQEMKMLGVKRLAVVSSLGASARSFSHYLRCKGKMELAIERMNFDHVVFVRPGPLKGLRETPRKDEFVVQSMLSVVRPLMVGPLRKLIPIDAEDVAYAMQYSLFLSNSKKVSILDSSQMRQLLKKYQ